ncbi:cubilin-like [Actinia tenebrosa]|uniref:Cubilin-like n=1 Tax=Actinia tenebrosa TaxID=6105 RepID=A0A6P8GY62_ACTTE|nr:cubilin-like [Actinia tenebrosa]
MSRPVVGLLVLLLCAFTARAAWVTSKRNTCEGELTGSKGTFSSPNYPQNYPDNALCQWTIKGPSGTTKIEVTFEDFDVEWGSSCEWDSVIIKDKEGNQVGKTLCGRLDKPKIAVPGDTVVVVFKSDDAANEKGFQANFVAIAPVKPPEIGSCNFDEGLCTGLMNVGKDDFDWTINSGATPTAMTGPKTDHSGQGKYIYMESTGRAEGDKAHLETEVISGQRCLRFFYHMYGIIGMGSLNVYIQTRNTRSLVMSLSGNQGNEWKEVHLQINEKLPYKVVFEGIVGKSDFSDIALDDLSFSKTPCPIVTGRCGGILTESSGSFSSPGFPNDYPDNSRCQWIIQPQVKTAVIIITFNPFAVEMAPGCGDDYVIVADSQDQPIKQQRFCGFYGDGFGLKVPGHVAKVYFHSNDHLARKGFHASYKTIPITSAGDCDFDNEMCPAWTNVGTDDFDWSIGKGNTPSFFTGPSRDFYGLGNYAFTEASKRRLGDRALLVSGFMSGTQCLSFSYNMNGRGMGSLIVFVKGSDGVSRTVWTTSGDHGKFWLTESINIFVDQQPYQVVFEGVVGRIFTSDIAIDEISFKRGRCPMTSGCGGLLTAASGSFHSPNFPSPYPSGVDCTWTIIPPPQFEDVAITFHHVDLEQSPHCRKDYLVVEDITGTLKGSKICGTKTNQSVEVDWHQSRVHFHSDKDVTAQGFEASYRAFGSLPACGGELAGNTGTFSSPNYPSHYPNRIVCDWEIQAEPDIQQILITFEDFAIDDSPLTCSYDYLLIIDSQHRKQVGKYCGMTKPLPIKIAGNAANIRFQASHLSSARGFKAHYTTL